MKFFKILGLVLASLLFLFIVVGLFLPKTAVLERRLELDATAYAASEAVLDLYEQHLWPIWDHGDSAIVFTPLPGARGYSWQGPKVAYGECEFHVAADNSIRDQIRFRGKDVAQSLWILDGSVPVKLHLVFTVTANGNLGTRWTNLFIEGLSGPSIDRVLAELKSSLETEGLREDTP
ncbi:MAG: hypothetical protein WC372_09470 [Candidatus Neomarinimicrobiota bacterium]|jgi:hypothetical protein